MKNIIHANQTISDANKILSMKIENLEKKMTQSIF